jgi:hypothetical protein
MDMAQRFVKIMHIQPTARRHSCAAQIVPPRGECENSTIPGSRKNEYEESVASQAKTETASSEARAEVYGQKDVRIGERSGMQYMVQSSHI